MRFLCDENFPLDAVAMLRSLQHEVQWISEFLPGAPDWRVLALAREQGSVLLTFDRDFGALAESIAFAGSFGIVYFRLPNLPRETFPARIVAALASRTDWAGRFSVVEPGRVRMRKSP